MIASSINKEAPMKMLRYRKNSAKAMTIMVGVVIMTGGVLSLARVCLADKVELNIQGEDFREVIPALFASQGKKFEMRIPPTATLNPITLKLPPTEWEVALKFLAEAANVRYRQVGDVAVFELKTQPGGQAAVGAPVAPDTAPSRSGATSPGAPAMVAQLPAAPPAAPAAPQTVPGAPTFGAAQEEEEKPKYEIYEAKHLYSGGLALLFGGNVIPTMAVASPAGGVGGGLGGGGFGGLGGGGFGGLGGGGFGGFGGGGLGGFGGGGLGGFGGGGLGGFGGGFGGGGLGGFGGGGFGSFGGGGFGGGFGRGFGGGRGFGRGF